MADRTFFQLTIADCPHDEASEVLDIIDEYDLMLDEPDDVAGLAIGVKYGAQETVCGSARKVAEALQRRAPGASWKCWEDPCLNWLGTLVQFTPELGIFDEECDGDGSPYFSATAVTQLMEMPGEITRCRALGELHRLALDGLIEQARDNNRTVVAVAQAD